MTASLYRRVTLEVLAILGLALLALCSELALLSIIAL